MSACLHIVGGDNRCQRCRDYVPPQIAERPDPCKVIGCAAGSDGTCFYCAKEVQVADVPQQRKPTRRCVRCRLAEDLHDPGLVAPDGSVCPRFEPPAPPLVKAVTAALEGLMRRL